MTTTVMKIIESFTTVNSTTNDEMDWEFTNVINSLTKLTKTSTKTPTETKKTKWGFLAIKKSLFSLWYCWPQGK